MSVHIAGPVAILENSGSAVYFSKASSGAGTSNGASNDKGTALPVKKLQNTIDVAYWGEDNRFPQNIEQQMAYCGVGKAGLGWKARVLYGAGIVPGKVTGINDDKSEQFTPLPRSDKTIYSFLESRSLYRFFVEYLLDWTWYSNCFPEVVLDKLGKTITGFVHQESCDARFKQMNDQGEIDTAFLSKFWGMPGDQFAKFDPKKAMKGLLNGTSILEVDNKFVKKVDCIDMYDSVNSLTKIAEKLKDNKGLKSAILPVNYPSTNKTYYQVPEWDGARLGGWVEIASKLPSLIKTLYNKAFRIKNHIEIPETFFENKYGNEKWDAMSENEQLEARKKLVKEMDDFLSGDEKAFKTFVSFFDVSPQNKAEYGRIKITPIEDKSNIEKDLITGSAADIQILISMGVNPTLFGAGTIGTGQQRSGGSDLREAYLIYTSLLNLERQVLLEPLYLARDFNKWDSDIVFRFRDTVLTTLDTGAGTAKKLS